jgi:hypothetical protein
MRLLAAAFLLLHGLTHLLGTAVYLRLLEPDAFPYKTTVLGGQWDLGTTGIRVFGGLWAGAALGFAVAAVALLLDGLTARLLLLVVTVFSLLLTTLDWTVAYAGIAINGGILLVLFLTSRM